jgi:hypothetical protein
MTALSSDRRGGGDEGTGSDSAGDGQGASPVAGGRDPGDLRSQYAALEETPRGVWLHRRREKPSPKRVPLEQAEEVLQLHEEKYFDPNVRHFHEKLREVQYLNSHRHVHGKPQDTTDTSGDTHDSRLPPRFW